MGVQAAMIIHAAGASAQLPDAESTGPPTHAVALTAAPAELARLARTLAIAGLPLALIHEPDPPWRGALMAIGLAPMSRVRARRHLAHVALVRGQEPHV